MAALAAISSLVMTMSKNAGFTLLELLLVIAIVAFSASVVVFMLPSNQSDEAKQQANILLHRIELLSEEALLSGRDYGLRIDTEKKRYYLQQLDTQGWQPLQLEPMPYETKIDQELELEFSLGGSAWQDQQRLFEPGSLFDEEMFADVEEQKVLPAPQVFLMSSGEVTPFSIAIYPKGENPEKAAWSLVAKENGEVKLLAPGEHDEAP